MIGGEVEIICKVDGVVAKNGICGHILCSSDRCGAPESLECEHKTQRFKSEKDCAMKMGFANG